MVHANPLAVHCFWCLAKGEQLQTFKKLTNVSCFRVMCFCFSQHTQMGLEMSEEQKWKEVKRRQKKQRERKIRDRKRERERKKKWHKKEGESLLKRERERGN